jgi:hypothetical protein
MNRITSGGEDLGAFGNPNQVGSCRHLYSKTISLVGMLASINNSKGMPKLDDNEIGEDELETSEEANLDDIVQIGDNNYSSTKPTMRR